MVINTQTNNFLWNHVKTQSLAVTLSVFHSVGVSWPSWSIRRPGTSYDFWIFGKNGKQQILVGSIWSDIFCPGTRWLATSEVEGPKFSAERSNRRDFPDTKEEFEERRRWLGRTTTTTRRRSRNWGGWSSCAFCVWYAVDSFSCQ